MCSDPGPVTAKMFAVSNNIFATSLSQRSTAKLLLRRQVAPCLVAWRDAIASAGTAFALPLAAHGCSLLGCCRQEASHRFNCTSDASTSRTRTVRRNGRAPDWMEPSIAQAFEGLALDAKAAGDREPRARGGRQLQAGGNRRDFRL